MQGLDYSRCLYDPNDKKLDVKMGEHEEFKEEVDVDKRTLLRYIVLMYDVNTPLRRVYPDHNNRKREAARLAGFRFNAVNRRFAKKVEDMLLGYDTKVAIMVTKYLTLFGIPEYVALEGSISQFGAITQSMVQQKATKDEMVQYRLLLKDIRNYEEVVFGGEETLEIRQALYKNMRSRWMADRPEGYADRLIENPEDTLDEDSPYGEGYKVDKLKFIGDEEP